MACLLHFLRFSFQHGFRFQKRHAKDFRASRLAGKTEDRKSNAA